MWHTLSLQSGEIVAFKQSGGVFWHRSRMVDHKHLKGSVDRRAPRSGINGLIGPLQGEEPQNIPGPYRIRISRQGLDSRHRHPARSVAHWRNGGRAFGGVVAACGIQIARPFQDLRPVGQGHPGPPRQSLQPPQPARLHSRCSIPTFRMQQNDLWRTGRLSKVVRRKAYPPFGWRQPQGFTHGSRQEGINWCTLRPGSFFKPGHDQPVRPRQPRLNGTQNAQTRMGRPAGPHTLARNEPLQQIGKAPGAGCRQSLGLIDQSSQ